MHDQRISYLRAVESLSADVEPVFRSKFVDLPGYLTDWSSEYIDLRGKRILDFGCGAGVTAGGMAFLTEAAEVVGIDLHERWGDLGAALRRFSNLESLPENLSFRRIECGETPSLGKFDLIYSWSVFEHVRADILPQVMAGVAEILNPGGFLYIQISPLYYSPEGGHLWEIGYKEWEHLTKPADAVRRDIFGSGLADERTLHLWRMFEGLNRVTADDILHLACGNGFSVKRVQRDLSSLPIPAGLEVRFETAALRTKQLVVLLQKNQPA